MIVAEALCAALQAAAIPLVFVVSIATFPSNVVYSIKIYEKKDTASLLVNGGHILLNTLEGGDEVGCISVVVSCIAQKIR